MYYAQHLAIPRRNFFKLPSTMLLAGGITFSLFVVMDKLTTIEGEFVPPKDPLSSIDVVYQAKDEVNIVKPQIKPMPEVKTPPPSRIQLRAEDPNIADPNSEFVANIPDPTIVQTKLTGFRMGGGEATPTVRVEPRYPIDAARNGVEGWVKLIFSIDASGQVKDIEVLDSEPKRTFDRAAKRALTRWKYKPQFVDGQPTVKEGIQVVLDFKLNS